MGIDSLIMIPLYACNYDFCRLITFVVKVEECKKKKKKKKIQLMNICLSFLQDVLALLRSMYALICLEEDAAFLRYGYLSMDNAAAVRKEVTKLCSELRPHALALVTSFGIPDAFLSPIAFNWIDANAWASV